MNQLKIIYSVILGHILLLTILSSCEKESIMEKITFDKELAAELIISLNTFDKAIQSHPQNDIKTKLQLLHTKLISGELTELQGKLALEREIGITEKIMNDLLVKVDENEFQLKHFQDKILELYIDMAKKGEIDISHHSGLSFNKFARSCSFWDVFGTVVKGAAQIVGGCAVGGPIGCTAGVVATAVDVIDVSIKCEE